LANKINANKEELVISYLTKDWNNFYNNKIINWSNLFNRKLCYEEKTSNFFNDYSDYDYPRNSNQESSNNENENVEDNTEKEDKQKNENENVNLKNYFIINKG
jgi:hypothetical protein